MFELTVQSMSCGGCVRSVTNSVRAVDGNAVVTVDLASKTVRVDSDVSLQRISSAIADAGYAVTASAEV